MAQYKLIQKYPSLPNDWEEGMIVGTGDRLSLFAGYSPCNSKYTDNRVHFKEVLDSNFWEEVIQKDYEVLEQYSVDYLEPPVIHSVKRLSDGEIFKVGNKVKYTGNLYKNHCTIGTINAHDTGCVVHSTKGYKDFLENINYLEKINEPVMITEDGVELNYGDEHFPVELRFFKLHRNAKAPSYSNSSKQKFKIFSTKEKAEEYIIDNKPCLSLNDIKSEINLHWVQEMNLEKLIKSRL